MTLTLRVNESVMPNILSFLEDYIRSRDVEVVDDVVRKFQEEILVSSKEEVQRRVMEAEKRIALGDYLDEEEYQKEMQESLMRRSPS